MKTFLLLEYLLPIDTSNLPMYINATAAIRLQKLSTYYLSNKGVSV